MLLPTGRRHDGTAGLRGREVHMPVTLPRTRAKALSRYEDIVPRTVMDRFDDLLWLV
jgi:hypothetical protein